MGAWSKNGQCLMLTVTHTDGPSRDTQDPKDLTTALLAPTISMAETSSKLTTERGFMPASRSLAPTPRSCPPSGSSRLDLARESRWVISSGWPDTSFAELLRTSASSAASTPSQSRETGTALDVTSTTLLNPCDSPAEKKSSTKLFRSLRSDTTFTSRRTIHKVAETTSDDLLVSTRLPLSWTSRTEPLTEDAPSEFPDSLTITAVVTSRIDDHLPTAILTPSLTSLCEPLFSMRLVISPLIMILTS